MFVQIIEGKIKDPNLLARQTERWTAEIKPGARGYLGSTGGTTSDGRGVLVARFESAEAAQANSARAEQDAWWSETVKAFDGEPSFRDCTDVDMLFGGGSNDAGFVQVITGRVKDQDAARRLMLDQEGALRSERPDLLGGIVAWHGDGTFTQVVYFTSEADARKTEQATNSSELAKAYADLMEGSPTFYDLPEPQID